MSAQKMSHDIHIHQKTVTSVQAVDNIVISNEYRHHHGINQYYIQLAQLKNNKLIHVRRGEKHNQW